MPQYIAFLRGINVGGHRVRMDRLRGLFEQLDLTEVSTFIASGNLIFSTESDDSEALIDKIERHLAQELGYEVATFLRSPTQLADIAALHRVADDRDTAPTSSHYVIFLRDPPPEALRSELADLESDMDRFDVRQTEIHWRIKGKLSDSPLFDGGLNRATRAIPTTTRNMNTLRRIAAKLDVSRSP